MSIPVLILGDSGTGKSASLRNLDPAKTLLIQSIKKPLPFKSNFKPWDKENNSGDILVMDNCEWIKKAIANAESWGKEIVVIDDFQYLMANEFMRRSHEKGFDKFTEIAKNIWSLAINIQNLDSSVRVYFLSHLEHSDHGSKAKTIGKLLDDKITLEGLFTIVLKTVVTDQGYFFSTQNNGADTVKSPIGLFESAQIDNDLSQVDQQIKAYYIGELDE